MASNYCPRSRSLGFLSMNVMTAPAVPAATTVLVPAAGQLDAEPELVKVYVPEGGVAIVVSTDPSCCVPATAFSGGTVVDPANAGVPTGSNPSARAGVVVPAAVAVTLYDDVAGEVGAVANGVYGLYAPNASAEKAAGGVTAPEAAVAGVTNTSLAPAKAFPTLILIFPAAFAGKTSSVTMSRCFGEAPVFM